MSPIWILGSIGIYFCMLLAIAYVTSKGAGNYAYFLGNKQSPWYLVAFGLIGDSLSGVTYISVPGAVGVAQFSYLQLVLGYLFGYFAISYFLLPIYYKMQLTSIYSYLKDRFGSVSQKTGSFFFLLSRLLGAAGRLYLAILVLQKFVFDQYNIPFAFSTIVVIALILIYTYRGGIKTLVWTDTFQSIFLLLGVILSILFISRALDLTAIDMVQAVKDSEYSKVFFWDWHEKNYFFKQFFGGMFIAISMTGLDQNMMQKNLSCRTLKEAQLNINAFSFVVVLVNVFFLSLGALLYIYCNQNGISIPVVTDELFPTLALNHLGMAAGLVFIAGLTAATFSSADSVLTALTTSFMIDFLGHSDENTDDNKVTRQRHIIHIAFAALLLMTILIFKAFNDKAIIDTILMVAGYTYGPLLGLFFIGIFTNISIKDKWVPLIAVFAPFATHCLKLLTFKEGLLKMVVEGKDTWLSNAMLSIADTIENNTSIILNYKMGNEFLIVNGLLTAIGLLIIKTKKNL
jgi:Na+/proline symporter